jgi:hypothetical protein
MAIELSKHCIRDRVDRLSMILDTVGMGEIINVFDCENEHGPVKEVITSTGILLLQCPKTGKLITAFMLTTNRAVAIYRKNGYDNPPRRLMNTIKNHEKKRKFLYE